MSSIYNVSLINNEGCVFDSTNKTNFKKARAWAAGRSGNYRVEIVKNYDAETNTSDSIINYKAK